MFADFLHYYKYTADQTLNEYAVRFFALCSSMYRLKARDNIITLTNLTNGFAGGKEAKKLAEEYQKQYDGNDKILQEVRNIKK